MLKGTGKLEVSKKRIGKILALFTSMIDRLEKEKEKLRKVIDVNDTKIIEATLEKEDAHTSINEVNKVISNLNKIING